MDNFALVDNFAIVVDTGPPRFFILLFFMNNDELKVTWRAVVDTVKTEFPIPVQKTIFQHTELRSLSEEAAEVSVESSFAKSFVQKYAERQILDSLEKEAGISCKNLRLTVNPALKNNQEKTPRSQTVPPKEAPALFTQGNSRNLEPNPNLASNLNPKYSFATFIVGNRNRLAHAAAKAVADNPGKMYNPLYLYGGVGLGKTHLMQAVGNELIRRDPSKKVLYVSCETFTNEFVASIQGAKRDEFKKKYRNVDLFLVDDIQFIAGKEGTQEEFFHTFNALYQTDKQIIITSDKVPSEIKDLEERLSSRFSMGMIADMQLPDLETREAILRAKCQEKGIKLPDTVLRFIAEQVETNIRELEGALTTVLLDLQSRHTEEISVNDVRQALRAFVTPHKPAKKSPSQQLAEIVCEFYSLDMEELKGPRRQKELVRPRQILMYLLKHELGMTFPTIGREIGGRDHTTVIHAVDKIEKEMKRLPETLDELQHIKEYYYAHK